MEVADASGSAMLLAHLVELEGLLAAFEAARDAAAAEERALRWRLSSSGRVRGRLQARCCALRLRLYGARAAALADEAELEAAEDSLHASAKACADLERRLARSKAQCSAALRSALSRAHAPAAPITNPNPNPNPNIVYLH